MWIEMKGPRILGLIASGFACLSAPALAQNASDSRVRPIVQFLAHPLFDERYACSGHKVVLSPCACAVVAVHINPVTNDPGKTGKPPSSSIRLKTADGVTVVLAHIQTPLVKKGDLLKAGQPVANVGNNGFSRVPHIHIGAWQGHDALQIRWDQKKMAIR